MAGALNVFDNIIVQNVLKNSHGGITNDSRRISEG